MQSDLGKLFIGGISWDTNEDSLKDYFSGYGEVLEAVIMKDRNTGRARGFGFVVFADPVVVERVINEKHIIDGRMVEAKKAVPREDHQNTMMMSRSNNSNSSSSIHGSPGQQGGRTRKIFVGGLASSVTEADFKLYFEQFGTITDVVVMYDHNTHRPRGFGFITYDSEDAVDKVLLKTFHELNGKVVEVKRAVPKELSPGGVGVPPSRSSPLSGYSYFNHLNRINNFLDGYNSQGFSPNTSTIGYGLRMDDARFSPIGGTTRSGFGPFGSLNFESGLNPTFGGNAATSLISSSSSFGRGGGMNHPYYNTNNNNRFANPIGYDGGNGGSSSFFSSASRNLWGGNNNNNNNGGGLNYGTNSSGYIGNGSGMIGGNLGNSGINWDSNSHLTNQNGGNILGHVGNLDYGLRGGGVGYDRISSSTAIGDPMTNAGYDGAFSDLYNSSSSVYGDPTWHSSNLERDGSGSFDYELGNGGGGGSDVQTKTSHGYVGGGYSVAKTQSNRG